MLNDYSKLIYTGSIYELECSINGFDDFCKFVVNRFINTTADINYNNNSNNKNFNVRNVENVCIKQLLTKFNKNILALVKPLVKEFTQMGQLSRLTHDLCILYCLCNIKNDVGVMLDFGDEFLNLVASHLMRNDTMSKFVQSCWNDDMAQHIFDSYGVFILEVIMPVASLFIIRNFKNVNFESKSNQKIIRYVNYISKDLQPTDSHNGRYIDPRKLAKIYCREVFVFGQRTNVVADQHNCSFTHAYVIDKNSLKQESMRLRKNQQNWQCYYCANVNKASNNECQSCDQGLNPLYFSIKNKSKNFTVNPQKFGIIRLFSPSQKVCFLYNTNDVLSIYSWSEIGFLLTSHHYQQHTLVSGYK